LAILEIPKEWYQEASSILGGRVPSSSRSKKKDTAAVADATVRQEQEDNQEQDVSTTVDIGEGSFIALARKMLLDVDPNWDSEAPLSKIKCSFTYNTPKISILPDSVLTRPTTLTA